MLKVKLLIKGANSIGRAQSPFMTLPCVRCPLCDIHSAVIMCGRREQTRDNELYT